MSIFLVFLGEVILLFFLSKEVTKAVSQIFFSISKNEHVSVHSLAFLFLPGVILHELSHLLVASILFVPTGEIEFLPEVRGNEVKMGSVAIAATDPLRRFLIGVAPFLFGLLVILLLFWYVPLRVFFSWSTALLLYGTFQICNTMFSSRKDMEGAIGITILFFLLIVILLFFHVPVLQFFEGFLNSPKITDFFAQAALCFGIIVGVDFAFVVCCQGVLFLFGKLQKNHY